MLKIVKFKLLILLVLVISCSSYEKFEKVSSGLNMPTQLMMADYRTTWAAVVTVISQFDVEEQNQESGIIKTRWIDNTKNINTSEAMVEGERVSNAKFKLLVNVAKTSRGGKEACVVSIYKRQVMEQDFLQGWSSVENDDVLEKTLLYRIQRVIAIDQNIQVFQKQQESRALQEFNQ